MTTVYDDCKERLGHCEGCPNLLESMPCRVWESSPVYGYLKRNGGLTENRPDIRYTGPFSHGGARTLYEAKCEGCGDEFIPEQEWQRFCEEECRREAWDAKQLLEHLAQVKAKPPTMKVCTICGVQFAARKANATTCYGHDCRNAKANRRLA